MYREYSHFKYYLKKKKGSLDGRVVVKFTKDLTPVPSSLRSSWDPSSGRGEGTW